MNVANAALLSPDFNRLLISAFFRLGAPLRVSVLKKLGIELESFCYSSFMRALVAIEHNGKRKELWDAIAALNMPNIGIMKGDKNPFEVKQEIPFKLKKCSWAISRSDGSNEIRIFDANEGGSKEVHISSNSGTVDVKGKLGNLVKAYLCGELDHISEVIEENRELKRFQDRINNVVKES